MLALGAKLGDSSSEPGDSVLQRGELARNLYAMHSAQSGALDFSSIVNHFRH